MHACRCQNDYMLLKSAAAIRRQLFAIEAGKCQKCKLDTESLLRKIKSLPGSAAGRAERQRIIVKASVEWGRNKETLKAAERLARHPVAGMLSPTAGQAQLITSTCMQWITTCNMSLTPPQQSTSLYARLVILHKRRV